MSQQLKHGDYSLDLEFGWISRQFAFLALEDTDMGVKDQATQEDQTYGGEQVLGLTLKPCFDYNVKQ